MKRSTSSVRAVLLLALLVLLVKKTDAQVEIVQAQPMVQMTQNAISLPAADSTASVGVEIVGNITQPVTAILDLLQPETSLPSPGSFNVTWLPGENATQYVDIPMNGLITSDNRVEIYIASATNADISEGMRSTTLSVEMPQQTTGPQFSFISNTAAYPGDDPTITIKLNDGQITEPTAVMYKLHILTPAAKQFIPIRSLAGFVQFDSGSEKKIAVPIVWSAVPPEAEYRIGMSLEAISNARVLDQSDDVALHVFGVASGTCPPGAAVKTKGNDKQATQTSQVWWQDDTVAQLTSDEKVKQLQKVVVLVDGSPLKLSVRIDNSTGTQQLLEYGGMVTSNITTTYLCIQGDGEDITHAVVAEQGLEPVADAAGSRLCCEADSASCSAEGWKLDLEPGQNRFNISVLPAGQSLPDSDGKHYDEVLLNSRQLYSLAVVRLADEAHVGLQALVVTDMDGNSITLCGSHLVGPSSSQQEQESSNTVMWTTKAVVDDATKIAAGPSAEILAAANPCTPDVAMTVNISSRSEIVTLAPELLFPNVDGVRVEVSGQVLSRGGNVSADRVEDTTPIKQSNRTNASFLPTAFIMGLQYGVPVELEVVVVAEDGVTSGRYPVSLSRQPLKDDNKTADAQGKSSVVTYMTPVTDEQKKQQGWPTSPAASNSCDVCPAGWSSSIIDAPRCEMCPPGTFAQSSQSSSCEPCGAGSYAFSWGSSHCNHCITGTYAAEAGSSLCKMCPESTTTAEDGQVSCNVTVAPATDLNERYAVVVSFSLYLTGTDLEAIILKTGVNAPAESIVGNLLRVDTATAFNISVEDVHIMGVSQVSRRVLQANVSATLGVDLPSDATEEDIAAALEVQKLSADKPIELLSQDPDAFFGRTTRTLEVGVQPYDAATVESRPQLDDGISKWALLVPGILGIIGGSVLVFIGVYRGRTSGRFWSHRLRVITNSNYRYSRHV